MRVIPHQVNRLVIEVTDPFEAFRQRYEDAVPQFDRERFAGLVLKRAGWDEVLAVTEAAAPHGFLIYWSSDVTPLMALAGDGGRCVQYLMGNHTIAERMYRHDPAVMLYAPLRTAICTGPDDRTYFVVDQPSTVFSSFGVREITEVGRELDRKLAGLLKALGVPVPDVLAEK
ncbi:MAG TPA: DUF302 domain-containing protein [bacterium]|nr:DUF302 domain-containing protein [bacterium]